MLRCLLNSEKYYVAFNGCEETEILNQWYRNGLHCEKKTNR